MNLSQPQGSRPVVFFTRHGKDSVRMVVPGMEGRKAAEKLKWGLKLRLDVKKPVIGLAAHPREQALVMLFGDGALRGYAMGTGGLVPTFTLPGEARGRGGAAAPGSGCEITCFVGQHAGLPPGLSSSESAACHRRLTDLDLTSQTHTVRLEGACHRWLTKPRFFSYNCCTHSRLARGPRVAGGLPAGGPPPPLH